ncbi:hypothetical protein KIH27_04580 [Mycobacterium sp. M1]|uniref:Uncharacterized protein n=1 Tax=Mycolicibacter acidiphilus TaxID=2835306 RepID=A0ABS5RF09_9MYCO|nr:hypothetical protein [Mycolicibacter acidiphilus]MBS9532862.1 hypothetical protein [Mycolicibacter acidiphilus]
MDADAIYEIARYRRGEDSDGLSGRRQLITGADGSLAVRHGDGRVSPCPQHSAAAAIAADPGLHGIDPIEVTEICGRRDVLDELPLLLRMLDEAHPPESYEVYVEDDRWDVLETVDGPRAFPEGYAIAGSGTLPDEWVAVRWADPSGAVKPVAVGRLGLVTPAVVADVCVAGRDDPRIAIAARGDDAGAVAGWLLHGGFASTVRAEPDMPAALIGLFAAAAAGGTHAFAELSMALSLGDDVVRDVLGRVADYRLHR